MPETFREMLYTTLCINGGIGKGAVALMDGSESYKAKHMSLLRKRGVLETVNKVTRFTLSYINLIKAWGDMIPEEYLPAAKANRKELTRSNKERMAKRAVDAEVIVIMLRSGVTICTDTEAENGNRTGNLYIPSHIMKEGTRIKAASGDINAALRSRARGTLITGTRCNYNIYLMQQASKFDAPSEYAYTIMSKSRQSVSPGGREKQIEAVVFIGALTELIMEEQKAKSMINAGYIYREMYVYPKTIEGQKMFALLLVSADIKARLDGILFGEDQNIPSGIVADNAWEEFGDKTYELNFLMPDIKRLYMFRSGIPQGAHAVVHCFAGYVETLKVIMPEARREVYQIDTITESLSDSRG